MAGQVRIRTQGKPLLWAAGANVLEDIGRGMVYRELYLRLTGQLTLVAADNTQALTNPGDEWAVVKNLKIIANANDEIWSVNGPDLRWLNYFLYGVFPVKNLAQIGGGAANPQFDSTLIIPFWSPRSIHPMATALDSGGLASLSVQVNWGTYTDINADATGFTANPQITIESAEIFNVTGPFSRWNMFPMVINPSASNPKEQVRLQVGPMYRGFMLKTLKTGTLAGLKLKSGTNVYVDIESDLLNTVLGQNRVATNLVQVYSPNIAWLASSGGTDSPNNYFFVDLVQDGHLSQAVDSLNLSEMILELNVTQADTITIYPLQIIPVRSATTATAPAAKTVTANRAVLG